VACRVHNIQIDTISVVSRSHNLITFNRYPSYEERTIWDAERKGHLFEYWSHAMCLMPMETYPLSAWRKQYYQEEMWSSFRKWGISNRDIIDKVLKKVREDGVVNSASLGEKKSTPSSGWWDWKVEKRALEYLFYLGELMVAFRSGFQKYYDIPERVLPSGVDTEPLSDEEAARYIVQSTLSALGLATQQDFRTYHGAMPSKKLWQNKKEQVEYYLDSLVKDGLVEEVRIEGFKERHFALSDQAGKLQSVRLIEDEEAPVKILSPFDNIMRERHLPRRIWKFDYTIECYVPPPNRKYGYFVLPILDLNRFAGRLDAKAHRKEGKLEIKSLYLEDNEIKTAEGLQRLKLGIEDFAHFHNCQTISVGKVTPLKMAKSIRSLLNGQKKALH
ncbi:MAG: winged helix-turn-helix domain-containing protein, partial [Candidatus Thorarchaeota archaeon]